MRGVQTTLSPPAQPQPGKVIPPSMSPEGLGTTKPLAQAGPDL